MNDSEPAVLDIMLCITANPIIWRSFGCCTFRRQANKVSSYHYQNKAAAMPAVLISAAIFVTSAFSSSGLNSYFRRIT